MKNRINNMVNVYLNVNKGDKVFYYCPNKDAHKMYEIEIVDRKINFVIYPKDDFVIEVKTYAKLSDNKELVICENKGNEEFFLYKTKEDAIENVAIQPERINIAEYIDAQFGNVPFFTNPTIYEVNYGLRKITAMDFSNIVACDNTCWENTELDFENPLMDKWKLSKLFQRVNKKQHYFIDKEDAEKAIRDFVFVTFHNN